MRYLFSTFHIFLLTCLSTMTINAQWVQTNGPGGGYVSSFAVQGTNIFAATFNGVSFSSDNGISWNAIKNGRVNTLTAWDSSIFAGTIENGVFRSTDNGTSWTALNNGLPYYAMVNVFTVSDSNIYAGTSDGIFLLGDNDSRWISLGLKDINVNAIVISDTNILAGTDRGVFRKVNNLSASWDSVNSGLIGDGDFVYISSLMVFGTNIFAGTWHGVFCSSNKGLSWTAINSDLTVNALMMYGANIFAGTESGIFCSSDNGNSWTNSGLQDTSVIAFGTSGTNFLAGTYDGVFRSTDGGKSWKASNQGLANTNIYSLAVAGTNIFAGTGSWSLWGGEFPGPTSVFRSTDNGTNWTAVNNGLPGIEYNDYISALTTSGTILFAGTDEAGVFRSIDNGENWSSINIGLYVNYDTYHINALTTSGTNLYAGTRNGIFRSSNNGISWSSLHNGLPNEVGIIAIAALGTNLIAASQSQGVFRSTDNGTNWAAMNDGLVGHVNAITIIDTNFFAASDYGVFRCKDNGLSWTAANNGLHGTGAHIYISKLTHLDKNLFAVKGEDSVFLSKDNGNNWIAVNYSLPENIAIKVLAVSNTNIFAGTLYNGVWKLPLSEIITSIEESKMELPVQFELSQNYPNPFNPSTTIKYSIPKASFVSLKVYDILGREIASIVNDEKAAGNYQVQWDAKNFATGIYLYKIQAGSFVETKKMLLLK